LTFPPFLIRGYTCTSFTTVVLKSARCTLIKAWQAPFSPAQLIVTNFKAASRDRVIVIEIGHFSALSVQDPDFLTAALS
jgi:hypothetical protein